MPRRLGNSKLRARSLAASMLCVGAIFAAGCGSANEKFESGEADRALAALDAVQTYVDEGRCAAALRRVRVLATQSTRINSDRPELGEAYASSVARLQELVTRECVEIKESSPTDETTAPTGPTEEPTEPTPEPEPEPTPEPTGGGNQTPPDQGGNDGNPPGENQSPGDSGGASPG